MNTTTAINQTVNTTVADLFLQWRQQVLPKYKKIRTKGLLKIIRTDRDRD